MSRLSYRRKRQKRQKMIKGAAAFLIAGVVIAGIYWGISARTLEQPYDMESRMSKMALTVQEEQLPAFAADLCVVSDESVFHDTNLTAQAASIFGVDSKTVLYSNNSFEKLYPASMTKIMTILVALKYGNLDGSVTVTDGSVITESGASVCGIKPGDVLTLEQLLYGLMMPSGNDAANAIAIHLAGSVEAFAEMMNEEAKSLGATSTHFVNPNGLHNEDHYSTAYDLYLMFNELLKYDKFLEIIGAFSYTAEYKDANGNALSQTWTNSNWFMNGGAATPENIAVLGGKTGTTNAAGYCLIMLSEDAAAKRYISVIIKADSRSSLYKQMTNLLYKINN